MPPNAKRVRQAVRPANTDAQPSTPADRRQQCPAGADSKGAPASTSKRAGKAGAKPARATAATSAAKGKPDMRASAQPGKPRLKAFGLDPLVLAYVETHTDSAPHGPAAVAKAIKRSSGARLRQVSDKPLRYDKIAA